MASDEASDGSAVGTPEAAPPPRRAGRRAITVALRVLVPLAVVAAGGLAAWYLVATGPKAVRKPPERRAMRVDVEPVAFGPHRAVVHAMGTVGPARVVGLQPRVSGEIVEVAPEFLPGGRFRSGETLLQIDKKDYDLAAERATLAVDQANLAVAQCDRVIEQRQGALARAESDLKLELGQQAVARREFEMLGEKVTEAEEELVLRQPQLRTAQAAEASARAVLAEAEVAKRSAQAAVQEAQNALARARLDLARTLIRAPFNAVVRAREVNLGATVSPTTPLATLVGTDAYWVEVSVPVDQLRWIRIPQSSGQEGSAVRVYNEAAWGPEAFRTGCVCRLASDLESEGRMARLMVTVDDPLALGPANQGKPVLLIGSYVRVEIEGEPIASAAAIGRSLLRDGTHVWVMNAEGRLEIRPVTIAFRGRDDVLVTEGVRAGERLVVTDLGAPVEGMPLRVEAAEGPAPAPKASAAPGGQAAPAAPEAPRR